MTHRNARLTPVIRAERITYVQQGWPQAEVARLFRVSRATVGKWVRRFREGGPAALDDRPSRPAHSPGQTSLLLVEAICVIRREWGWGPHRIGWALDIARSTVMPSCAARAYSASRGSTAPPERSSATNAAGPVSWCTWT